MTKEAAKTKIIKSDKFLEEAFGGSVLCLWLDDLPETRTVPESCASYYGSLSENPFRKNAFDTVATTDVVFGEDPVAVAGLLKKHLLLVSEDGKKPVEETLQGLELVKSGNFSGGGKKRWFLYERGGVMTGFKKENVSLIVYDFDGVMTDNRVVVGQDGKESVMANRSDGLGVGHIRKMGIGQIILSTETNPVVGARAAKLKLETIQGCADKKKALADYCRRKKIDLRKVMFVGNDLNDVEVMGIVGFVVAPSDAWPEAKDMADYVTEARGGHGVIRELAGLLIRENAMGNIK